MQFLSFSTTYPQLVGAPCILLYAAIGLLTRKGNREKYEWLLLAAAFVFMAPLLVQACLHQISVVRPLKLDLYIYQLDGLLGFEPSFVIGRLLKERALFTICVGMAYNVIGLIMLIVFWIYLEARPKAEALRVMRTFALSITLAVPVYLLFPVCGPRYAFKTFPSDPGPQSPHGIYISDSPNGIPSIHFSTALLIFWFLRRWKGGRFFGAVFLVLTILATLGLGEHYVFDLIVAIPYTFAIYRLANWCRFPSQRELRPAQIPVKEAA